MSYEKQNFVDGQILTAEHLNHMEQGIADASPVKTVNDTAPDENGNVKLPATSWGDLPDKPFTEEGVIEQTALPEGYPYAVPKNLCIFPEQTAQILEESGMIMVLAQITEELMNDATLLETLPDDSVFNLALNGEQFVMNIRTYMDGGRYIGNLYILEQTAPNTGENFVFLVDQGMLLLSNTYSGTTEITVSLSCVTTQYTTLKKAFLPDDTAQFDTTIDTTGMPAEITWDGDTTDRALLVINGLHFCKISDLTPSYDELVEQPIITKSSDSSETSYTLKKHNFNQGDGWLSSYHLYVCYKTGTYVIHNSEIEVTETGLYAYYATNPISYTSSVGLNQTIERKGIVIPSGSPLSEAKFFLYVDDLGNVHAKEMA